MYKKILVPLDGSAFAETILPHVRALASCTGAEIVLVQVVTEPALIYAAPEAPIYESLRGDLRAEAEAYLKTITAQLAQDHLAVTSECSEGIVAEAILEIANRVHADLIAMSTHGRGSVAKIVLGSVAESIVQHTTIPILLVHPH